LEGSFEPSDYEHVGESGETFDVEKGYESFTRRWRLGYGRETLSEVRSLSDSLVEGD
jgi:hypothetical protein